MKKAVTMEDVRTPHAPSNGANQAGSFCYLKPSKTIDEQIDLMTKRGLIIDDIEFVRNCLLDVNYYRLRGFWLSLESDDCFVPDTTFSSIWNIYCFDEELRLLLQSAICPIEIKVRTQYSYYLSQKYGPDAHITAGLFQDRMRFEAMHKDYEHEKNFSYENGVPCVVHNLNKYGELPIWAAVEILSFGKVLKSLKNLKDPNDQKTILSSFGHKKYYVQSWLDNLNYTRNLCAHHNRVYNRITTKRVRLHESDKVYDGCKQFPTFLVLKNIYFELWPSKWIDLCDSLKLLIRKYQTVDIEKMGFPDNWENILRTNPRTGRSF